MAYLLSDRANGLLNKTNVEPNIVLKIEGYNVLFGVDIVKYAVTIGYDDLRIGNDWTIGGLVQNTDIVDYISLDGTTTNITHQLDLDKSNATSTQTVKIRLVDFNQEITKLISPGYELNDILYRNARLYLGFKEGSFPEDYIDLFIGKIQTIESGSGFIELTIAHPEELKRTEIFPKFETVLTQNADYYTKTIQDLTYYQISTYTGVAQVRYVSVIAYGDNASVSVSGNLITVTIESGVTKAKTICDAINNNSITSKMVLVKISGTSTAAQVTQAITSLEVDSEIFLDNVDGFYLPEGTIFRTYVRINDEIIEYTGIDTVNKKLTGCVRKSLDSLGQFHEIDDTVTSFYKLGDNTESSNAIDLTLKLMLSDGVGSNYIEGIDKLHFYNFGTPINYPNGFLIPEIDAIREYNIRIGDFCTITGASNSQNNFTNGLISNIEVIDLGTIVYINNASFVFEDSSNAVADFKSQYNVLPDGCGFIPNQVDIERFNLIKKRFPSSIPNYEFYLKDTIKPKDFINNDLFLPSALYSIPRQGKVSVGISAPPLYETGSKILNLDTVKNPAKLKTTRTINKYFYNAIIFKYNEDSIDDRQLSGEIIYSADSQNRINSPNKPYTITARGMRPSALNSQIITRNAKRLLERYQFAAETIPVEPDYKTGFCIEVGDSVIFGDESLLVSDTINATREFKPRVFEVVNKEFDWKLGKIRIQIVDTNYSAGVRYGVWSPASIIGNGSTSTAVKITSSFGSDNEKNKWIPYINKTIRVRSSDYSHVELTKFLGFDSADQTLMMVSSLSTVPSYGYIIDVPNYEDLNVGVDSFYKALHPFWTPTLTITSGVSETQFNLSSFDAAKLFEGSLIRVRSNDYSIDSYNNTVKVESIVGNLITCTNLGFTPSIGYKIDLVGFVIDEGQPYVWL